MATINADAGSESRALFAQVRFYVVLTDEIGLDEAATVSLQHIPPYRILMLYT